MKFLVCLIACLFIASGLTQDSRNTLQLISNGLFELNDDRATLQLLYNGFYEQGGLPDPQTVLSCYDDASTTLTVTFIGTLLSDMANNNVVGAETAVTNFQQQLPQAVFTCLAANAEVQASLQKYGVLGLTLNEIITKLETYALTHFAVVHQDSVVANNNFINGQYVTVGQEGGEIIQLVFSNGESTNIITDSIANLQLLYNGFFEQSKLADPTTVLACYSEDSAQLTIDFIQTLMNDIVSNNVVGAQADISKFEQQLPVSVQNCLKTNQEFQAALTSYNLAGWTLDQITTKLETYTLTHFLAIKKLAQAASDAFQAANYVEVGKQGAIIAQTVYGQNVEEDLNIIENLSDDRNTLQLLYNGFYGNVGLPNPTTVLACYDDASVTLTVNFIGTLLTDMANNDVVGAETAVTNFQKQLPQAVFQCLGANAEVQASLQKYNVEGLTLNQIIAKLEAYALTHFVAIHQAATVANGNFQNGQYVTVGQEGGQIIQLVFGNSQEVTDDRNTLQLLYNGFYGNVGLPNGFYQRQTSQPHYCPQLL